MIPAAISGPCKRLARTPLVWGLAGSLALHAGSLAGFHYLFQPEAPAPLASRTVALTTVTTLPPKPDAVPQATPAPPKTAPNPPAPPVHRIRAAEPAEAPPEPLAKPVTPDPRRAAEPLFKAPPRKPEIPAAPQPQAVTPKPPAPAEVAAAATQQAEPSQLAALPAITPPTYGRAGSANARPRYPWLSRQKGEQGRVVLLVTVDDTGRTAEITVKQSSGFGRLDRAAMRAVRTWRFTPAHRGGRNVTGTVEVPVRFRLNDG